MVIPAKLVTSWLICVNILILLPVVRLENVNITISLNSTFTADNNELYGDFAIIKPNSTIQANVQSTVKSVTFIIFQVHSHLYNVTLYNNTLVHGSYVSGTNVGLYSATKSPMDVFYIWNPNDVEMKLYISVHGYGSKDPVPGGCNMEFPINISPFMQVRYNQAYITVDAAPAKDSADKTCQGFVSKAVVKFYKMYLQERQFDEESYFDGIRGMMTIGKIRENGDEVPRSQVNQMSPMRRILSSYPGTGSVYVAVAYHASNESLHAVYVPTYTYACSPAGDSGCVLLDDITSQIFCAALMFIGLFTCYFGHRFFKTEMFLVGTFAGIIITYVLISLITELERPVIRNLRINTEEWAAESFCVLCSPHCDPQSTCQAWRIWQNLPFSLLGASMLSGVCFGSIWLLFWWFYGIPLFAVLLSTMYVGFLTSSILYNGLPGGLQIVETDSTFWPLFISIMIITALCLVSTTFISNILSCAVLGSYAVVFVIDHYVGSHLKFLVINTVRRATVEMFNAAVLDIPFQWRDAIVTVMWVLLATSGFLFQHFHSRGKPPFPPPPRSVRPLPNDIFRDRRYGAMGDPFAVDGMYATEGMSPARIPIPVPASAPVHYDERTPLL